MATDAAHSQMSMPVTRPVCAPDGVFATEFGTVIQSTANHNVFVCGLNNFGQLGEEGDN